MKRKNFTLFFLFATLTLNISATNMAVKFTATTTDNLVVHIFSYTGFEINWGDGNTYKSNEGTAGQEAIEHEYLAPGEKTITIYGDRIYTLAVQNLGITSMSFGETKTLEFFSELLVSHNQLKTLDVSNLKKLGLLGCSDNQLSQINLSKNEDLKGLIISNNPLTSLDLSKNILLEKLHVTNTDLNNLSIDTNSNLKEIQANSNELDVLDLSRATALETLSCSANKLAKLDISSSSALKILVCGNNKLKTILLHPDVSELDELQCQYNALSLATFPRVKQSTEGLSNKLNFTYNYQDDMDLSGRANQFTIDMSDIMFFSKDTPTPAGNGKDQKTTIMWYDVDAGANKKYSPTPTETNGIYTFNSNGKSKISVRAEIMNRAYSTNVWKTQAIELPGTAVSIEDQEEEIIKIENGVVHFNSIPTKCTLQLTDLFGHVILIKNNPDQSEDLSSFLFKGRIYILTIIINNKQMVYKISA